MLYTLRYTTNYVRSERGFTQCPNQWTLTVEGRFSVLLVSSEIDSIQLLHYQCDQIGRFIGLGATFQSLRPQLICPNLLHSKAIFVKVSKSLIFLVKLFLGNFYGHLAILQWPHWSRPLATLKELPPYYLGTIFHFIVNAHLGKSGWVVPMWRKFG